MWSGDPKTKEKTWTTCNVIKIMEHWQLNWSRNLLYLIMDFTIWFHYWINFYASVYETLNTSQLELFTCLVHLCLKMLVKTKPTNTQASNRQKTPKVKLTLFHSNQTYASLNVYIKYIQLYVLVLLLPVNKILSVMRQKTLLRPSGPHWSHWCFPHCTNSWTFLFLLVCLWKALSKQIL